MVTDHLEAMGRPKKAKSEKDIFRLIPFFKGQKRAELWSAPTAPELLTELLEDHFGLDSDLDFLTGVDEAPLFLSDAEKPAPAPAVPELLAVLLEDHFGQKNSKAGRVVWWRHPE